MTKKIIFTLILLALLLVPTFSNAEEIQSTGDRVTVVPAKFELWGMAGKKLEQTLKITNEDSEQAIIALSMQSFKVVGEDGDVILEQNSPSGNDLSKWITFDKNAAEFSPKETKFFKMTIDIPEGVQPGGKYASVVVSMDRVNRQKGQIGATSHVVSLIMLTVAGDIQGTGAIESFRAIKNSNKSFFDLQLRVKNNSRNHIKPIGRIVLTNIWGRKIDEVALNEENVLPDMIRRIDTIWKPNKILFGRYTATLVSTYGYNGNLTLTGSTAFWVLPWFAVMGTIVLFAIIGFIVYLLLKRHRVVKSFNNQ